MSKEERLARLLLANEKNAIRFEVELHDDRERDLVASYMEQWGCVVEADLHRPRLLVTITPECLASGTA